MVTIDYRFSLDAEVKAARLAGEFISRFCCRNDFSVPFDERDFLVFKIAFFSRRFRQSDFTIGRIIVDVVCPVAPACFLCFLVRFVWGIDTGKSL